MWSMKLNTKLQHTHNSVTITQFRRKLNWNVRETPSVWLRAKKFQQKGKNCTKITESFGWQLACAAIFAQLIEFRVPPLIAFHMVKVIRLIAVGVFPATAVVTNVSMAMRCNRSNENYSCFPQQKYENVNRLSTFSRLDSTHNCFRVCVRWYPVLSIDLNECETHCKRL